MILSKGAKGQLIKFYFHYFFEEYFIRLHMSLFWEKMYMFIYSHIMGSHQLQQAFLLLSSSRQSFSCHHYVLLFGSVYQYN